MVNERDQLAEAILNHALEIVCLLTEDFMFAKRSSNGTPCTFSICAADISDKCDAPSGCPELFLTVLGVDDKTQKMIEELANNIVWLLTKEVPLKCEDVAVYFSKDEWEYLEEHEERYKNNHDSTIDPVQQSTENNYPIKRCIKQEPNEEPHPTADRTSEFISRSPERKPLLPFVNVPIPVMEVQAASGFSFLSPCDIKTEPGEESSETTIDSVDAGSPQFPPSPDREQIYNIIHHTEGPEGSKDACMSVSGDTISPDCTDKDDDYLPPKTSYKRARTRKSNSKKMSAPCEVCGKVFGKNWYLERHLQTHTGQRPFPCKECSKTFLNSTHLAAHKRTHSGERPFPCNECGRRFINQQHLVLHQVVHTREKPFSCLVCKKRFTRQSSVVKHSAMHAEKKPYVCNECGKSYCQYASLVVHQRVHSGEKPFVCTHCEKAFACKATMLKHQMAHSGERPFACHQCDKRFTDNSSLSKHRRRVHAKEPKLN